LVMQGTGAMTGTVGQTGSAVKRSSWAALGAAKQTTSAVAQRAERVKKMALQVGELGLLLYTAPEQRQRWGDTQVMPHVEWGDLFFDLFYVGAAYNLGGLLKEDPSFRGILYFCAMFFPLIQTWKVHPPPISPPPPSPPPL
jgi:hypothetical protein